MKASTLFLMALILLAILIRPGRQAFAFHAGGVGPCDACHAMHAASGSGDGLLKASDAGSTCLNCHEHAGDIGPTTYHISTPQADMPPGSPPRQLTPGGDFGWLKKTYTWTPDTTHQAFSYGDRHGHNIVANDYLYAPDVINVVAPGGAYQADSLTCISCHDPHGTYRRNFDGSVSTNGSPIIGSGSLASSPEPVVDKAVGVYRLLGGKGYLPKPLVGGLAFVNDPPAAVAPDDYNRSEAVTQTRVAYGSGMSEWCRNCHPDMHTATSPGSANLIHPAGNSAKLGSIKTVNYNSYIKTGDPAGLAGTSYLSLVPFEEGISDYPTLKMHAKSDDSVLMGPDGTTAQVMCLTCHRAHASGWDGGMRWNADTDFIVYNGSYAQEGQSVQPYGQGRTEIEAEKAYYDLQASRFALNQDTLCHKCHAGALP